MPVDPDLAAVLLAFLLAALLGAAGGARRLRRAKDACESCGRRLIRNLPTCDCNPFS